MIEYEIIILVLINKPFSKDEYNHSVIIQQWRKFRHTFSFLSYLRRARNKFRSISKISLVVEVVVASFTRAIRAAKKHATQLWKTMVVSFLT